MNTAEFLDLSSAMVPDRAALICGERQRTYTEMAAEVTRLANAMQGLGLTRGDHVGVMSVNSAEYVLAYYACAKLGLTFVPLNYRAKADELSYMINTAEIKALFLSDRYQELLGEMRGELSSVQHYISLESEVEGQLHYASLVAQGSDDFVYTETDDDDA